jgi:uncharacterized membrane protein YhaH (DUF805 family)
MIVSMVLGAVLGILQVTLHISHSAMGIVNMIYPLAILIPGIAVAVRRMHDTGRCGWWILCPIANIVFLCLDSQPGDNKYGLNPKLSPEL